jgi:hypothetical protein
MFADIFNRKALRLSYVISHNIYFPYTAFSLLIVDIVIFANCNWVDSRWQYTFTHKQRIEHQHLQQNNTNNKQNNTNNKFGRVLAVPSHYELYLGICLTTEEKARKNLSQGSRR